MTRGWLALGALLVAVTACGGGSSSSVQGGIGLPSNGQVAWKFVGVLVQDGSDFSGYGYLTHIDGLDDGKLYSGDAQSEKTARFTMVMRSHLTSRSKLQNVTVVDSTGTVTIYYNSSPGGSFDDPSSFAKGTQVAQTDAAGQNIMSINPDNRDRGIAAATAQMTQTGAPQFSVDGQDRQFGRQGLVERMALSGQGVRTDPSGPKSRIEVAGDIIVVTAG